MNNRKFEFCKVGVIFMCLVILLLASMLFFCKTARADNYLSVGIGNTQFKQNDLGSGTWHQAPEYGAHFIPDSPARQIIFGRKVYSWLGIEAGLHDFGRSEIYAKWTSDHAYQSGKPSTDPLDVGFTSVRLRGYSAGVNLSAKIVIDWFARYHIVRYRWDFSGYFGSGTEPTQTTIGSWHCNVRGYDPMTSVGFRIGRVTIEQTRIGVRHSRESDVCTSNFTGAKTVFIGYEWRF